MGLTITEAQAEEIIDFYDRKQVGEMDYKIFLEHVCEDMDVFLTYTEETPRTIEKKKKSMTKNPFVIKEFKALPNKTLGTKTSIVTTQRTDLSLSLSFLIQNYQKCSREK